jgi:hypothetical protein
MHNVMRSVTIMVLLGIMVGGVTPVIAAPMEDYGTYNADNITTDAIGIHSTGASKNRIPLITYLLDIDLVNDVFENNYTIRHVSSPDVCFRCFSGERCPNACIMYNVNQPQKLDLDNEVLTPADPDPADSIIADGADDRSPLTGMSVNEFRNITLR